MRAARLSVLALTVCFIGAAACFAAENPQIGTWKLNEPKSKIAAGSPKAATVVYEAAGDNIRVTVDGTDGDKPTHSEWIGKFNGKDYPVTGDSSTDTRSYQKVNNRTLSFRNKKGGRVTLTGRITVSADGKIRTVTTNGNDAQGKEFTSTAVYDKQ